MNDIHIGPYLIGPHQPPFIIAEMSGNHGHDLDKALRLVDAAAAAGAQALKLQTYRADTMTLNRTDGAFFIEDPDSLWHGQSLYQLYEKASTPWEWHAPIFERARRRGMVPFSTPFDDSAVDLLERLEAPCYKIASFENGDLPLIRRVAATGKPLIISTGMATLTELAEAVESARTAGCRDLILLKCTSSYPAEPTDANLLTLPHLAALFDCQVGLSDHTLGTAVAVAAVALGARVVEKHFTLRRADGDVDAAFSLEPEEFACLTRDARLAWQALGGIHYGPTAKEKASRRFRRSLYIACDLEAGARLTRDNLTCVRPAEGLEPRYLDLVLGRALRCAVKKGTPLRWELICS